MSENKEIAEDRYWQYGMIFTLSAALHNYRLYNDQAAMPFRMKCCDTNHRYMFKSIVCYSRVLSRWEKAFTTCINNSIGRVVGLSKTNSSVAKMICFNNANFKQID